MQYGGRGAGGVKSVIPLLHVDLGSQLNALWKSNLDHFCQIFNRVCQWNVTPQNYKNKNMIFWVIILLSLVCVTYSQSLSPHPLLCQFILFSFFPWVTMNLFFFLIWAMKNFFLISFRNFGISLITMTPVTQPGIRAWSLLWKGGHFQWTSFIYRGLTVLAFLVRAIGKPGLFGGLRSSCVCLQLLGQRARLLRKGMFVTDGMFWNPPSVLLQDFKSPSRCAGLWLCGPWLSSKEQNGNKVAGRRALERSKLGFTRLSTRVVLVIWINWFSALYILAGRPWLTFSGGASLNRKGSS